ncbi:MAG: M6 family metalloprotease domain-containing protein [Candidatus Zixiibacteriota bacterium]
MTIFKKPLRQLIEFILLGCLLLSSSATVSAMPPHPDIVRTDSPRRQAVIEQLRSMRARGIDQSDDFLLNKIRQAKEASNRASAEEPFKVLAILVEFFEQEATVPAVFFDSLIFNTEGNTVHDYFDETSQSLINLVTVNLPSTIGWLRAPSPYYFYVNENYGTGDYPNNSQKLVEDLVNIVNPQIDFSEYDNDGDGYVDLILVIHSGSGAEFTGDNDDIWSHKWQISDMNCDGVKISDYTIQPEYWLYPGDMTIGVYCHELSHGFGLPDLYDVDGSSYGIGYWGIMSYGSWNGPLGMGSSPSHHCAWSKVQMGIGTVVDIDATQLDITASAVEIGGTIYRLHTAAMGENEYFLIENRQPLGYDSYLPGDGLLVWHIDDAQLTNSHEWYPGTSQYMHYLVALEQADGLYQMEHHLNCGDAGDPYPGNTGNLEFGGNSLPDADSYVYGVSSFVLNNISASDSVMYFDVTINLSTGIDNPVTILPQTINLNQNYPNPFNPETRIEYSVTNSGYGRLEIFNVLGRRVKTLYEGYIAHGNNSLSWDGTNDQNESISSGAYFYRLTVGGESSTKKMILVR